MAALGLSGCSSSTFFGFQNLRKATITSRENIADTMSTSPAQDSWTNKTASSQRKVRRLTWPERLPRSSPSSPCCAPATGAESRKREAGFFRPSHSVSAPEDPSHRPILEWDYPHRPRPLEPCWPQDTRLLPEMAGTRDRSGKLRRLQQAPR